MKKYKDIFFDLDHTLWDYETNSKQTLFELYERFDLATKGANDADSLLKCFTDVNDDLWDKYNKGEISQYFLRNSRFPLVFKQVGINPNLCSEEVISEFNECYMKECSQKPNLIDGTVDLLNSLQNRYSLHIITNGFEEVQSTKLRVSGIASYFDELITSERAGAKKPFPAIYDYALKVTGALVESSVMIGDNLKTDINGALNYGMDQVYYNPKRTRHETPVTHEVENLHELRDIL